MSFNPLDLKILVQAKKAISRWAALGVLAFALPSWAGYYSDVEASCADGRCHHGVTSALDPDENFTAVCKKFIDEHHDSNFDLAEQDEHRYMTRQCETQTSVVLGNMCDKWSGDRGVKVCIGDYWYITMFQCPANTLYHQTYSCLPVITLVRDGPQSCKPSFGNPIFPVQGVKAQSQSLGQALGSFVLELKYDSRDGVQPKIAPFNGATSPWIPSQLPGFGNGWSLNFMSVLEVQRDATHTKIEPLLRHSQGASSSFNRNAEQNFVSAEKGQRLSWGSPGGWTDWKLDDYSALHSDLLAYRYAGSNPNFTMHAVQRRSFAKGGSVSWTYSSAGDVPGNAPAVGLPYLLKDQFGRQVRFQYTMLNGEPRITSLIGVDGFATQFVYDDMRRLIRIIWPDNTNRQFVYEVEGYPSLLTGVIDEQGKRFSTYGYMDGLAASTELAGGVQSFRVSYIAPPRYSGLLTFDAARRVFIRTVEWTQPEGMVVTDPHGAMLALETTVRDGRSLVTSQTQPAGSGCAASIKRRDFDDDGRVTWSEDFKGYRTCFAYDSSRNLEVGRIEGLASGSVCSSVIVSGAPLPDNARRVGTQWHPSWHLQTKIAAPKLITTNIYNGQADPFNGGATAWCAPANATLPDGTPLALLCKQVEQTTTDGNGSQGFNATLEASLARVHQWTYNEHGQVITAKDPLNNTYTYTYYGDTTSDHTVGDLATIVNGLNQVVARYTKYAPTGDWLELLDANGIPTTRTFDARRRLKASTTSTLTTSYDYWPTGQLRTVIRPDGSFIRYGYDDAHRLTSVMDHLGNKISYTLDTSGNRIAEIVTDPVGRLAKTLTRAPDALNRIQQVIGRE